MAKRKPPKKPPAAADPPKAGSAPDPTRLSIEALAKLLSKAGGRVILARTIEADVAAGAPRNPDGTMHLIHYAAWLAGRAD